MWLNEEVVSAWRNTQREGKRGYPRHYTETAIVTMASV